MTDGGGKPYPIPAGASDHPRGGLGFAGWAFEVEDQEQELGLRFGNFIVCSVTGSTQAGMIAGSRSIDLVREGAFRRGSKVLYAHLGGQPALNGYTTAFETPAD